LVAFVCILHQNHLGLDGNGILKLDIRKNLKMNKLKFIAFASFFFGALCGALSSATMGVPLVVGISIFGICLAVWKIS
jgi:hypothetical protein